MGSAASLKRVPLDGAEDPTVEGELGINTFKPLSSGSIGGHQAVVSFIARDLGGCLGLNLMQTVPPQCSAACKGVFGSAIVSPRPYHKIIAERGFLPPPHLHSVPSLGPGLCFSSHPFNVCCLL